MIITPFVGIGDFHFKDDIEITKLKATGFDFDEGERFFMGIRKKTIFIERLGLDINFNPTGDGIESFGLDGNSSASFEGINMFETKIEDLKKYLEGKDENLDVSEDGVLSKKFGIGIYGELKDGEYTEYPHSIVLYRRNYLETLPTQEEIYNYYMKDDDDENRIEPK